MLLVQKLAIEAAKDLDKQGKGVRVVSIPNWFAFEQQSEEYKESVILKKLLNVLQLKWHLH